MAQTFIFLVNEDRASEVIEEGMQVWDKYFAPHMKDMNATNNRLFEIHQVGSIFFS
jgi:hypothetical protein